MILVFSHNKEMDAARVGGVTFYRADGRISLQMKNGSLVGIEHATDDDRAQLRRSGVAISRKESSGFEPV
jgi:hypothetical protein